MLENVYVVLVVQGLSPSVMTRVPCSYLGSPVLFTGYVVTICVCARKNTPITVCGWVCFVLLGWYGLFLNSNVFIGSRRVTIS